MKHAFVILQVNNNISGKQLQLTYFHATFFIATRQLFVNLPLVEPSRARHEIFMPPSWVGHWAFGERKKERYIDVFLG
jgi:uncharacterized MAPEG superfamily protein